MKKLGEVFSSLYGTSDLPQLVAEGVITKMNIHNEARCVTLYVKFNGLVERDLIFSAENIYFKYS